MRTIGTRWSLGLAILGLLSVPHSARAQSVDTIIEWNRILLTTLGTPGATDPNVFFTRPLAMMHIAIFEALNSIQPTYAPYIARVDVPSGASADAAVAQAAHDALVASFPGQRQIYDAALATQLSRIPAAAAESGARVGAAAARALIEQRANDGWGRKPVVYTLPTLPGFWQPVPPANAAATFAHYADVSPFGIGNALAFRVEQPPALTSERYAADFNEVKAIGASNSTTRTSDQTLVARLFAVVGTTTIIPAVWNNLTADLVRSRGLNAIDAARLYALVNMTFHDALYSSFSAKFLYGLWRPVTAIREADRDGNPATAADPGWLALIPTPPYPTYPGNYACLASAITRGFARTFGRDDIAFTVTWAEANGPGWTRSYNRFSQLAEEAAKSRVYGGIHFDFDTTSSFGVCTRLGEYIFDNTFRRR